MTEGKTRFWPGVSSLAWAFWALRSNCCWLNVSLFIELAFLRNGKREKHSGPVPHALFGGDYA